MTDKIKKNDDIYHHPIIGYGSTLSTWKEAKSINNNITLEDIKQYMSKLQSKQIHFKYKGYNSFVAKDFLEQIQVIEQERKLKLAEMGIQ